MAAEKLTKARLVQILIIFSVLATAFTWRTFQHQPQKKTDTVCQIDQSCTIKVDDIELSILFERETDDLLTISVQLIDSKKKTQLQDLALNSYVILDNKNHQLEQRMNIKTGLDIDNSRWSISTLNGDIHWITLNIHN
ncbi:hypothetical protein [Vibrio algivorus]|uniref:Uncharacterized protein n=1 Tax=Vibrio algivorus TaxID=1667024 RepID=A0A557P7F8_9VIBR|nr:hypothetical protein [Vibrio algivorus]TVO36588.1 hypothetical protein FOF44_08785 [Vibrio algivorus]GLT14040.1 hypothetical protein GCM10007931_10140 [Vibrio algivorus]